MRKLLFFNLSILLVTLSIGCNLGFDCELRDGMPEFDTLVGDSTLEVQNLIVHNEAFDTTYINFQVVVNNDSTYNSWQSISNNNNCTGCTFPTIDFNQKTMVGWLLDLGCKGVPFIKLVKDSDTDYRCIIKFVDDSQCSFESCEVISFIWFTVDKLPENANITYVEGESHYDCDC